MRAAKDCAKSTARSCARIPSCCACAAISASTSATTRRTPTSAWRRCRSRLALQRLEERDDVADLIGIEAELGHGWVPGDDALPQRLFQRFDRVALVQRAE